MDSTGFIDRLRWLEKNVDFGFPQSLKDKVHALRLKAIFLVAFLSCRGKHHNHLENRHLQALLVNIRAVFQSVDLDIGRCMADSMRISSQNSFRRLPTNIDDLLSRVLQRFQLLKPDIHEFYTVLSNSTRSAIYGDSEALMENLNFLLENIEDLLICNAEMVAPVKEELEAAQKSLGFSRDLLAFTSKRCSKLGKLKDLIIHAEFLLDKMSCLLYLCSNDENMNVGMVNEIKIHLSSELQNFSPAQRDVREIYIKALKASKSAQGNSAVVDKFDWDFLDSLRENILQLPDAKLCFMASNKDQILSLHEELQFLTMSFAMYKSSEAHGVQSLHTEAGIPKFQISNYFVERISAAIVDMGCLAYSLHNNEQNTDEAKELKRAVSDLQDIIKTAKEDARKAYDMYIPKSWLPKIISQTLPTRMVRSLMNISEIMRSSSSIRSYPEALIPHGLSGPLYEVLQKEMLSLIEAFRNLTANRYVDYEEVEFQVMRLNDIRNETENLISSFSLGLGTFWSRNLWLFVLIGEIKMIKMEFEDLHNKMARDTSRITEAVKVANLAYEWSPDSDDLASDELAYAWSPDFDELAYAWSSDSEVLACALIPESDVLIGAFPITASEELEIDSEEIRGSTKLSEKYQLWLETNMHLICPQQKPEVNELRLRVGFLEVFLCFKGKWHVEDGNLKVLLSRICSVFQNANQDLQRLWADMAIISQKKEWWFPANMDCLLSSAIERFQLLKPDIQEVYTILSESSRFLTGMSDKAVMENLDSLQENIKVLFECNTEQVAPLKEELEAVQKNLRLLKNFLGFTVKRCGKIRNLKDLLIHSEFLASRISCLLYLCCDNEKMNDQMENEMKMHLLSELRKFRPAQPDVREIYIKALKASKSAKGNSNSVVLHEFIPLFLDSLRDDILELSNHNPSFVTCNKHQVLSLLDKLKFLITFCAIDNSSGQYPEPDKMSNSLFQRINDVIIDIGCVIYSLNDDEENEKMPRELELNKKFSDLEAIISVTNEDTRKVYDLYVPKSLRSNFPRTNGQGFISSLLWNLNELVNTKTHLVSPLEHHIDIVRKELLSLSEDFSKITQQPSQCEELQSQWTDFLDIAYRTEYVIDSFLGGDRSLYCHKLGLFNVIEDIKTIRIELKAMENKITDDTSVHNAVLSSKERLVDEKSTSKLVIFGEEEEKIREQLMRGSRKLSIISIVGMPGIGKTTLADSLFQHSSVTYHFHVRARCSVSQVHDKRRLLLEILQQVTAEKKQYGDDDDVDQKLYQSLKGRRYLILLDDLWDIKPWEHMKASFPDDENGSRIILTSRFDDIATQAGLVIINFRLSPLPEEKSWEMLQVKLFGNNSCPPDLASVGYEIAANCKGLPLTIDLVAGALRMKQIKEWKKVAESLMAILFGDPERRCWKVLELSYQNLPEDLKPCFLYFAAFPEDANVPTRDLILLWIAEGFVKLEKGETRSLEDVAKHNLDNLISRSLVTVSRRGSLGQVDASHVHDLLHEFAVAKAQEESFMLKVDRKADFDASHVHDKWRRHYRLCSYPGNLVQFLEANSSGSPTRALICSEPLVWDHLSLIFGAFKLLRVLYIPNVLCPYCPEMFRLIHLRLLAISTSVTSMIFSKIHKLRNLETLIVECRDRPREIFLPYMISNMVRLRHLCFDGYVSFRYSKEKILERSSLFSNLQTLYHLQASCGEEVDEILKLMPNLIELKVLYYDSDRCWHPFPRLDFLKKLESLEVTHQNIYDPPYQPYPCKIMSFPPHLKRLVLSNFGMPWTEISQIGNLEYLEVLELRKGAFTGPTWNMIDGQFPNLKYLSLSDMDIEEWNALEDHLPCFEQLYVAKCRKFKELPSCLAEIGSLQTIEIFYCTEATENSAKRIKDEQEQMGNEQLVVDITEDFWKDKHGGKSIKDIEITRSGLSMWL